MDKYSQKPASRNMIPRTPIALGTFNECSFVMKVIRSFIAFEVEKGTVLYFCTIKVNLYDQEEAGWEK